MKTCTREDTIEKINELNSEIQKLRETLGNFHDTTRKLLLGFKKAYLFASFQYVSGTIDRFETPIPDELAKIIREWLFMEIERKEKELDGILKR